jgi:hypothetical protein
MTVEDIERILQTVAENQANLTSHAARTDERLDRIAERLDQVAELQARHSADIAEIDQGIAMLLKSQNRYEERQNRLDEILHDLADKQLKNEERFADLAAAELRYEARQDRLEAVFEMFVEFARSTRAETNGHFADVDRRIAALVDAQTRTDASLAELTEQVKLLVAEQRSLAGRVSEIERKIA